MADRDEHDLTGHWETHAAEWTAWAREPGHDAYWSYRDRFAEFLPAPGRATLEIGCGEGRVSRDLRALGHTVTATDLAPTLLAAAQAAGSAHHYRLADAADLPFADGAFDRVVAYNVLMDVPDMPRCVAEAGRVLAPGGHLTISIVHPFIDRGRFDGDGAAAPFRITGDYFTRTPFVGTDSAGGLTMHFAGWSHPLRDYTGAIRDAGLLIAALHEPEIGDGAGEVDAVRWRRLPLFCWIDAVRPG